MASLSRFASRLATYTLATFAAVIACRSPGAAPPTPAAQQPTPTTASGATSATPPQPSAAALADDSIARRRTETVNRLLRQIAGHENEPATTVFRNVKRLITNVSAGQLLRAMDQGFGRSLGVGCEHCHVPEQWASDSLRAKRVARSMIALNGMINVELGKLPDFDSPPTVSCMTCHRGQPRPSRVPLPR